MPERQAKLRTWAARLGAAARLEDGTAEGGVLHGHETTGFAVKGPRGYHALRCLSATGSVNGQGA
jgi:hypothetical protein